MEKIQYENKYSKIFKNLFHYKVQIIIFMFYLIISSILVGLQPLVIKYITDQGLIRKNLHNTIHFVTLFFILNMLGQFIQCLQMKTMSGIYNGFKSKLHESAFLKLYNVKFDYFQENSQARILNMIKTDIDYIAGVVDNFVAISLSALFQGVAGLIGLCIINYKLTLFMVAVIPIKWLVTTILSKKKNKIIEELIYNEQHYFDWLGEQIGGIKEIKLWGLLKTKIKEFTYYQTKIIGTHNKNIIHDQLSLSAESIINNIVYCLLYIVCVMLLIKNQITIGGVFAFISYYSMVISPLDLLLELKYTWESTRPSCDRILEFLEYGEELHEKDKDINEKNVYRADSIIRIENVSFSYSQDIPILTNINMSINKGDRVAIIGENGAGKSTLFYLLLKLYHPNEGNIKLYNRDISELNVADLRNNFAVVSQKSHFFSGSISNNIDLRGDANPQDIINAAEKSGAISFINNLAGMFDYDVGKNGEKLSGGEQQKIILSRTIIKNAPIVLWDEPTTSTDKSSMKYFNNIVKENPMKTFIFITHNYNELKWANKVYELKNSHLEPIYLKHSTYVKETSHEKVQ